MKRSSKHSARPRTGTPLWLSFLRAIFPLFVCLILLVLCEWIARGSLDGVWTEYAQPHLNSYILAWMLLTFVYLLMDGAARIAPLSVVATALLACVPAAVNFFTLKLRGEPFLPWDLAQISEAAGVIGAAGIELQPSMAVSAVVVCILAAAAHFLFRGRQKLRWPVRLAAALAPAAALLILIFGVYLQPSVTLRLGIYPDAWMQDRYYRWYGMISGFMTNLQNLEIDKPEDYDEAHIRALLAQVETSASDDPLFDGCYAEAAGSPEQTPTIIYVMDESYWDVSELTDFGITFDTDVSANLHRLQQTSAYGRCYSPSFGGGTCDVEFEALTGFSKEFLPAGSKPYQQHITHEMFALPGYLKSLGYRTEALHCFYAKYWSRNTAYPYLGFDRFLALEDMTGLSPKVRNYYWKSGLVTDADMGDQIIRAYEAYKEASDAPVFLHAVTMQNHTNYNAANYPDDVRVRVTQAPAGLDDATIGALEDFATGVRDADLLLGTLTDYFSAVDEPVILVFWGDHYNPINSNYKVYTETGYASDNSGDPRLHATTLLIWSNYWNEPVDIGTIAAYEITPVMMDLYGLEKPVFYEYLTQQLSVYRSRTCGVTILPDGTASEELTDAQRAWYDDHWLLQYDLMFGKEYALEKAG